ncbi:monovalent cation/H+ antiporter subunit D [Paracoccus shanxieyensis]|uniref:Monovalent cation/H+ antiporter subunit D n=1 Tax=Paracoccus shanxieyensis TaxID=2675752 RepID=A0A6L6ISE6_9RHOB|nr:monovalent cation/H+ antiporter subunit D [Paracoccus shanxieyensis]MTH63103.1 monovalent cation/H+ antiporter subunit D [Paracoccus shanxieyensis]MTH88996.1 monovalent cation/H+ antiporter subunit D [Paracoccus shanxieyensis]
MNHIIIAPVILPAVIGALIILWMRSDLLLQRVFSIAGTMLLLGVSLYLAWLASSGDVLVYRLGNWAAPFGIVLMLDRLAGLMLVLTSVMALAVQLYAFGSGWDRKGWHFHALWQFQLMGVCGAFLTGDAFNLFVFFEILLIASYGLMTHGGGEMRLRAGVQYIAFNLAGSILFLAALGVLYSVTGTLNMADMAARVAAMPEGDTALLRTGAVMLMLVFAIKASLVPLHFWLPSTYANAPGPVAALFAIMTKVGVYAIIRFFTLVFPQDTVIESVVMDLLLPAALFTLVLGQLGVMGTRNLGRMAAYAAIASVGMLMIAVAQFTPQATSAALYYMVHSTLAGAALFLVVDMIGARRGDLWLRADGIMPGNAMIAALFFASTIAMAGMPPLSGFVGKLLVLDATRAAPGAVVIWGAVLVTSLIAIYGYARAGSLVFWKAYETGPVKAVIPANGAPLWARIPTKLETHEQIQDLGDAASPTLAFVAVWALLAGLVALTVFAGPAMQFAEATAAQLHDPAGYLSAVLQGQEGTK